ncbi:MAG: arylsulfatase [Verrucomicrobiae bacterium]|nr:arylsulfatase [Verrucomicrobiae bacterium]
MQAFFKPGLWLCLFAVWGLSAAPAQPPLNIVFMVADDLGYGDVGCYGQKKIPTPHLDRLAAQGMRFTQHYSGAPVCAPARCVLMTGLHLGHAEIRGNQQAKVRFPEYDEGQHPLSAGALTFVQLLQQAGYATGAMGKWGLGPVGSTGDPNRKGFDLFFGYNCQSLAHSYYPAYLWRNAEKVPLNQPSIPGHAKQPEGEVKMEDWLGQYYAPDVMLQEALKFIQTQTRQQRPFFLFLPFIEPHVAIHPPKTWVEKFPREWDTEVYRGENNYLPHPRPRAGYAAMVAHLDDQVGQVLNALDQAGVTGHTLVIFTSDNGPVMPGRSNSRFYVGGADGAFFESNGGLRGHKGSVYEGGLRVPMIARLPGRIPAGTVNHTPSYFADWFPTLCQAVGLKPPKDLDGVSLWPVLTGKVKTLKNRPPMVWVFPESGGQVAVRLGKFKLVRQNLKTKEPGPWEIYDIEADPRETRDLAGQHPGLIRQAEDILKKQALPNPVFPVPIPGIPSATARPAAP